MIRVEVVVNEYIDRGPDILGTVHLGKGKDGVEQHPSVVRQEEIGSMKTERILNATYVRRSAIN